MIRLLTDLSQTAQIRIKLGVTFSLRCDDAVMELYVTIFIFSWENIQNANYKVNTFNEKKTLQHYFDNIPIQSSTMVSSSVQAGLAA